MPASRRGLAALALLVFLPFSGFPNVVPVVFAQNQFCAFPGSGRVDLLDGGRIMQVAAALIQA